MVLTTIHSNPLLIIALFLQLSGLTFSVLIDAYLQKWQRKVMLTIASLTFLLAIQNMADYTLEVNAVLPYVRTVVAIIGYTIRPILIVMFITIIDNKGSKQWMWLLVLLNTLIHLTALFSDICFSIDRNSKFIRGPLGFSCHIISGILLLYLFILSVRKFSSKKKLEEWIPLLNLLSIIAAVVLDFFTPQQNMVSYLTIAIINSSPFYYIWLHLQFVRAHEQSLEAEQRIQIMMTQIQPHFLFNTISTIKALCRKDPDQAADVATKFGVYLRQNLDSLGLTGQIPIQKELEHTRMYTDTEKEQRR